MGEARGRQSSKKWRKVLEQNAWRVVGHILIPEMGHFTGDRTAGQIWTEPIKHDSAWALLWSHNNHADLAHVHGFEYYAQTPSARSEHVI